MNKRKKSKQREQSPSPANSEKQSAVFRGDSPERQPKRNKLQEGLSFEPLNTGADRSTNILSKLILTSQAQIQQNCFKAQTFLNLLEPFATVPDALADNLAELLLKNIIQAIPNEPDDPNDLVTHSIHLQALQLLF